MSSLLVTDPTDQRLDTLAHVEAMMSSALALQSGPEFVSWLRRYVRAVAVQPSESARLEELCLDLAGPASPQGQEGWCSTIAGLQKRHVLEQEVLPLLEQERTLSRVLGVARLLLQHAKTDTV
mmetsp:Transcript_20358/g.44088  ORF Transcript_20358/g.44088 Transcript_20358/m.44088 type:complete len:123 (-) Transcript_20358:58-426(-)